MPRRLAPSDWERPALRWAKGAWIRGAAADPWPVRVGGLILECRPAAGGQVGIFPEHAATWDWLDRAVREAAGSLGRPPEVLSLFAYTGGATLACARAGARVAHVDASRPAVAWARRNAELSGLSEAPVRWLVDDVRALVRRERRRGRRYDGIVLDPPTYGHGAGAWEIEEHLPDLLDDLAALVRAAAVARAAERPHPGLRRRAPGRAGPGALRHRGRGQSAGARRPVRQPAGAGCVGAVRGTRRDSPGRAGKGALTAPADEEPRCPPSSPGSPAPTNPRIRAAAGLRDRRSRDAAGLTLVDGARELARALAGGAVVVEAFVDGSRLDDAGLAAVELARVRGAVVTQVSTPALDRIAFGARSEGVVATVRIPDLALAGLALPPDALVVVLEGVEKPGNLGAVLRSADGAGADAVIAADPRTDLFNPNAIRASLGDDLRRPPRVRVERRGPDVPGRTRDRAGHRPRGRDRPCTRTSTSGVRSRSILGSEADGLTDAWSGPGVVPVRLPMLGVADSLNVSIAAAVLLYEARRQRDTP